MLPSAPLHIGKKVPKTGPYIYRYILLHFWIEPVVLIGPEVTSENENLMIQSIRPKSEIFGLGCAVLTWSEVRSV